MGGATGGIRLSRRAAAYTRGRADGASPVAGFLARRIWLAGPAVLPGELYIRLSGLRCACVSSPLLSGRVFHILSHHPIISPLK